MVGSDLFNATVQVSDQSDDPREPTNTDPDADNNPDDPTRLMLPEMSAAKRQLGARQLASGSDIYAIAYRLVLENTGNLPLSGLDLYEDIAAEFVPAFVSVVMSPTIIAHTLPNAANLPSLNPGWALDTTQSVFADDGRLAPGETLTIDFIVAVDSTLIPVAGLSNQVVAAADNPIDGFENGITDTSDAGSDPASTNPGEPGDTGTPDDPTPLFIPDATVGLAKQAAVAGQVVTLTFHLENTGNVLAHQVTLVDDLESVFGAGNYTVTSVLLSTPPLDPDSALSLNLGFDGRPGSNHLLDNSASNRLDIGDAATITVRLRVSEVVDQDGPGPWPLGDYLNTAVTTSQDVSGNTYQDDSTNGTDPDAAGDGPQNDAVPTPIHVDPDATIGVAKGSTWDSANDTAQFDFVLSNFGNTRAVNLSLAEDLDAVFGVGNYTVSSPLVLSGPGTVLANATFNGSSDMQLLQSGSSLGFAEWAHLRFTVNVSLIADPQGNGLGAYANQVVVTNEDSDGNSYMDASVEGLNPDPDGDLDPTDNHGPSNGSLIPDATVGIAKRASVSAEFNTVTYTFAFEHFGNTEAVNIVAADDLDAVFGGGAYSILAVTRPSGPPTFFANGTFDGSGSNNLVGLGSSLLPGQVAEIEVVVDTSGVPLGTYLNTAAVNSMDRGGNGYFDDSDDGIDPDADNNHDPTDNDAPTIIEILRGSVSGTVYADFNNNGLQDVGEPGIPDVELTLTGPSISSVVTTDGAGNYSFTRLPAGDYTLTEAHPVAFIDGRETLGSLGGSVFDDRFLFSLSASQPTGTGYNFGEIGIDPFYVGKDPFLASGNGLGGPVPPLSNDEQARTTFVRDASRVTVFGTPGNDIIEVHTDAVQHRIIADFVQYLFAATEVTELIVDAGSGQDVVKVHGTDGRDQVMLHPHGGEMTGTGYRVEIHSEYIIAYGGGGDDEAQLFDAAGDDVLNAERRVTTLQADNHSYLNAAVDFDDVVGISVAGGHDVAFFIDSAADDHFVSYPHAAIMQGADFKATAFRFDVVNAYAERGGTDTAVFHDSAAADTFVGRPTLSLLRGAGFENRVHHFEHVQVFGDASDVAHLHDTVEDDVFVSRPEYTAMRSRR